MVCWFYLVAGLGGWLALVADWFLVGAWCWSVPGLVGGSSCWFGSRGV